MIKTKWMKIHPKWKPSDDKFLSDYRYGYMVEFGWRSYMWLITIKTKNVTHPILKVGEEFALAVIMDG